MSVKGFWKVFDRWIEDYPRAESIYLFLWRWTVRPAKRLRWAYLKWKDLRTFRPGQLYLEHGNPDAPMVSVQCDKDGYLIGVSLIDGRTIACDVFNCGPEPITYKEAQAIVNRIRYADK